MREIDFCDLGLPFIYIFVFIKTTIIEGIDEYFRNMLWKYI